MIYTIQYSYQDKSKKDLIESIAESYLKKIEQKFVSFSFITFIEHLNECTDELVMPIKLLLIEDYENKVIKQFCTYDQSNNILSKCSRNVKEIKNNYNFSATKYDNIKNDKNPISRKI